jgi:hypothetical protein
MCFDLLLPDLALAAEETGFHRGSPGPKFFRDRDKELGRSQLSFPWRFINIFCPNTVQRWVTPRIPLSGQGDGGHEGRLFFGIPKATKKGSR